MKLALVLAVWAALVLFGLGWSVATRRASPRLPRGRDVTGFFLRAWPGRYLLLVAWSYVGWHLFCQRP